MRWQSIRRIGFLWVIPLGLHAQEVGIGTTAPAARLDVQAPSGYANPLLRVRKGGQPLLVVTSTGKVGISTSTPTERLEVHNGKIRIADAWDNVLETRQGNWSYHQLIGTYHGWDSEAVYIAGYHAANHSQWDTRRVIWGSGNAEPALMVDIENQEVGIGVGVPTATLDVYGRIYQSGLGGSVMLGEGAGQSDDLSNNENVFVGYQAGYSNVSSEKLVAVGYQALYSNTSGADSSVAVGMEALRSATGGLNTAVGSGALYSNTTGTHNTAVGYWALYHNTTGIDNTAIGHWALRDNTTGESNTAVGQRALERNTTGTHNTAVGQLSLYTNTTGNYNTAIGCEALYATSSGSYNTAVGYGALWNNGTGSYNTAVGRWATLYSYGDYQTSAGVSASTHGSNATAIGYDANATGANRVRFGNASVTWIGGQVNWATYSDARIKRNAQENVPGLDFILRLRPVTYRFDIDTQRLITHGSIDTATWRGKYDIERIRFSGFIAQEVEAAAQAVGYDFSGITPPLHDSDIYSLRYAEFVVPLVKAVQQLADEDRRLQQRIARLRDRIARLKAASLDSEDAPTP